MSDRDLSWTEFEGKYTINRNHHNLVCTNNERVLEGTRKVFCDFEKGSDKGGPLIR